MTVELANQLIKQGLYDDLTLILNDKLLCDPQNPENLFACGLLYKALGLNQKALETI